MGSTSSRDKAEAAARVAVELAQADPDRHPGVPEKLRELFKAGLFAECYDLAQNVIADRYIR